MKYYIIDDKQIVKCYEFGESKSPLELMTLVASLTEYTPIEKDAEIKRLREMVIQAINDTDSLFRSAMLATLIAQVRGESSTGFDLETKLQKLRENYLKLISE